MKRLHINLMVMVAGCVSIAATNGCALGLVDDVQNTLDDIETTLDDLHTADCIRACTSVGEICLDYANGQCVDRCEDNKLDCNSEYDACYTDAEASCEYLFNADQCMDEHLADCPDCDAEEGDCKQACGDVAQECLTNNANCVADCVQELEDSLKSIQLN